MATQDTTPNDPMARALPDGYSLIPENSGGVVCSGDLLWHEDDAEWQHADRDDIGHEVYGFHAVARQV